VLVMGILNITPDSFSDGGRWRTAEEAVAGGLAMIEAGADLLDLGGESSRPGAVPVSAQEEMDRVLPILRALRNETSCGLSADTTKAEVAKAALAEGATMINDISALRADPSMARVVSEAGAEIVLMHMKGTPQTMQQTPTYGNVTQEVFQFLLDRAAYAQSMGIPRERIVLDPGIGFGKTRVHNVALLRGLSNLCSCGYPVMVGVSRKSFLGQILDVPVEDRLEATIAANTVAVLHGASMIRVHDVKEARRAADVAVCLRP
jgi:dihydropteroate synthase